MHKLLFMHQDSGLARTRMLGQPLVWEFGRLNAPGVESCLGLWGQRVMCVY